MKEKVSTSSIEDRFMRIPEVARVTGLSRSTIYNCVADGTFPIPVRLTARAIGWYESEIKGWMASRRREVSPVPGPDEWEHSTEADFNGEGQ